MILLYKPINCAKLVIHMTASKNISTAMATAKHQMQVLPITFLKFMVFSPLDVIPLIQYSVFLKK
jgi:hypothetical protein